VAGFFVCTGPDPGKREIAQTLPPTRFHRIEEVNPEAISPNNDAGFPGPATRVPE
jgi:hypothetical protein